LKYIDIVIATRNRYEKLMRTLNSIPNKPFIHTTIICDGDMDTFNKLAGNPKVERLISVPEKVGAVSCRNMATELSEDGVLYATDDMTFESNSIENAFKAFNSHFPDDDGVVGFVQIPKEFHPTGVALIGKKFIDRYPDRKLFNPEYHHFACQEIHWLASMLGKFHQEPTAVIRHYHPAFFRGEMDKTHIEARKYREKDHSLMRERQNKGLIWGN